MTETAPPQSTDGPTPLFTSLSEALARRLPGFDELLDVERLSGGASQETYRLRLRRGGEETVLALRRAAGGAAAAGIEIDGEDRRPGLTVEARIMQVAAAAGVPEPEVHLVLEPDDGLGEGFVMEWLDGETLGARIVRAPELAEIRPHLARQCGEILAAIHAIDPVETGLAPHLTALPTEEFVHLMWDEYKSLDSPQPMIDYTARWLLDHLPPVGDHRLVHNDFRNGNLMITPEGVTAVLDWEVAHLGDPMRDLGWICTRSWRFGRHDLPVGGFGHYDDLFAGYESVSGRPVDPTVVHFWEVFGSFWWAIGCLKMGDHWRHGPDPSVERPGIARRSSECQVDCVNLLIPGPVTPLVPADDRRSGDGTAERSSTDLPTADELLTSVTRFLRDDVMADTEGRTAFLARVAANSLDIVQRELALGPLLRAGERARLDALLGIGDGTELPLLDLRRRLVEAIRSGHLGLDDAAFQEHLRTTVTHQAGIDQPRYPGYELAVGET
ncbi:MAG: phosphotransferase family protein [Actinomycetota bacterium]